MFTVVIPTWNRAEVLSRAMGSVLSQSYENIEVIVVDDGSTDCTADAVAANGDPRLRYITQPNLGESAARNTGARAARGQYLAFLDSDDEVRPSWLDCLFSSLDGTKSDVALCGQDNVDLQGRFLYSWVPDRRRLELIDVVMHFEAGQVALRRELFLATGGYATAIRYGQHTELAIRLFCGQGTPPRVVSVPNPLVIVHRAGRAHDYGTARAESARYVLENHPSCKARLPHLWSSYHAIAGVEAARQGALREARRHFLAATRSEPSHLRHLVRTAAATVPPVARRVWPPNHASAGQG
jgi:glycosyltransferase involved in cell wall biosynthesis